MPYIVTATAYFAHYLLVVIDAALLIRALFSFIAPDSDSVFYTLVCFITEPILALCRKLLDIFNISSVGFFDMSFFLAVIITWILDLFVEGLL